MGAAEKITPSSVNASGMRDAANASQFRSAMNGAKVVPHPASPASVPSNATGAQVSKSLSDIPAKNPAVAAGGEGIMARAAQFLSRASVVAGALMLTGSTGPEEKAAILASSNGGSGRLAELKKASAEWTSDARGQFYDGVNTLWDQNRANPASARDVDAALADLMATATQQSGGKPAPDYKRPPITEDGKYDHNAVVADHNKQFLQQATASSQATMGDTTRMASGQQGGETQAAQGAGETKSGKRVTVSDEQRAAIHAKTGERWQPKEGDTRFTQNEAGSWVYWSGGHADSAGVLTEIFEDKFKDHGGIVNVGGPSGVGKGTISEQIQEYAPERHFVTYEQDWEQHPPEVRSAGHAETMARMADNPKAGPNEFKIVWDMGANHNALVNIRQALDKAIETGDVQKVTIPNAWHRNPNAQGQHRYDQTLEIGPKTIVLHDAVYPFTANLPGGVKIDDLTVELNAEKNVVADRFTNRTQKRYGSDPAVFADKMNVYLQNIAPSYTRVEDLLNRYAAGDANGTQHRHPVDLILRDAESYGMKKDQ